MKVRAQVPRRTIMPLPRRKLWRLKRSFVVNELFESLFLKRRPAKRRSTRLPRPQASLREEGVVGEKSHGERGLDGRGLDGLYSSFLVTHACVDAAQPAPRALLLLPLLALASHPQPPTRRRRPDDKSFLSTLRHRRPSHDGLRVRLSRRHRRRPQQRRESTSVLRPRPTASLLRSFICPVFTGLPPSLLSLLHVSCVRFVVFLLRLLTIYEAATTAAADEPTRRGRRPQEEPSRTWPRWL
mmetsp:Transcript_11123/g.33335  ORF Transcript_11123/g.33335 Transcript_11123/m.33335 type:complete len:241 (-) Transcript_11123:1782-2504(-)